MPELPEVETIRRQLDKVLLQKTISSVEIRLNKQVKGITVPDFKKQLTNSKIFETRRRAKMLALGIKKNKQVGYLVFHLKMTGQLIFDNQHGELKGGGHPIKNSLEKLPNKYSHVFFKFKDGSRLYFNDMRQFGWVTLIDKYSDIEGLSATPLGVEPLSKDFKLEQFIMCLKKRPRIRIYQALMDQRCVVGVGNIYANESLFLSDIRPTRRIKNINKQEFTKLYTIIKQILRRSVSVRGTTIGNYMDALGDYGKFSKQLKVYQRDEEPCVNKCGNLVIRKKINSRSTFYCPKCQK